MTLWIVLTVLTSVAAVLVAAPFLRRFDERRATRPSGTEVYLDQLQEVDREQAAGLIEPEQAALAKTEIKRRLLAADREAARPLGRSLSPNLAVVAIAGFVVLGSITLYALGGRPDLPAAAPAAQALAQPAPLAVTAAAQPGMNSPQTTAPAGLASVDEMIVRLVKRLEGKPDDPEGWRMLGWSYAHTERYDEAVKAYAKAVALRPDDAGFQAAYGEAMVRASNETVTPEAKAAFEKVLKLEPKEPRARYFMGLAMQQQGDKAAALESWTALLKEAGPNDDWAPELRQHAAALAKELGMSLDPGLLGQAAAPSSPPAAPPAERGPTAADVKAAESMSAEDRNAMVRRMVDGLAARLAQSPKDVDGWIKLIRSRKVLGELDAAKEALKQALLVFADAGEEKSRIIAAARELGLAE
ncbi:MAG: c-type cytochrome biogenesis protein CcmI [Rhodomicrobium sp.]|nr:c-type cytochrome biogenesis protein CcmI [Rhodomicrobium sp.]